LKEQEGRSGSAGEPQGMAKRERNGNETGTQDQGGWRRAAVARVGVWTAPLRLACYDAAQPKKVRGLPIDFDALGG
jgi:hypothetical protein